MREKEGASGEGRREKRGRAAFRREIMMRLTKAIKRSNTAQHV
jgi:hypothetical protein